MDVHPFPWRVSDFKQGEAGYWHPVIMDAKSRVVISAHAHVDTIETIVRAVNRLVRDERSRKK